AQIPATDINATGTASVIVSDPNSPPGTTSAQTVAIVPPSKDAVAFQINPAHTGAVTFNSVSFPSSAAWSVNVGGNPSYALIMQDKVIVTVKLSDGSSQLLALNQVTGSTVWGPIPIQGSANATYDNGRVFVVNEPYPADATLMAFDVATGALDWTTTLNSYGAGPPTAADGIIYVEQETGGVEAVAESSGAPLWTGATDPGFGTAAVTEDGVYIGMTCESYDLRPATGEVIWSYQINCSGGGPGTPVVANQLDYSPDSEYVSGGDIFNAETGVNVGTYVAGTPATFSQTMGYFLQSGTLRGVTLANNTVQWSFSGDGELIGSPIMVNQYVLIGSSLGNVYALDGTTGTQIWNVNLGTTIGGNSYELPFTGLAAGDGLLIVPSGTTVTAYTLSTNP
ncbi:MAG: PQQ-binding-like beta-propeller repeat protein, partial [Gammaproteobacteria bacterium]